MQTVHGYTDFDGARKYLGNCSRDTIYRRVRSGELTKYQLGTKVLFKIDELEALPIQAGPEPAGNDNSSPQAA